MEEGVSLLSDVLLQARGISVTWSRILCDYTYDVVQGGGHSRNVEYTGIDITGVVVLSTVNGVGTPED